MKTCARVWLMLALSLVALPAFAALNIFTCTPEWGSLAKELGGELIVESEGPGRGATFILELPVAGTKN